MILQLEVSVIEVRTVCLIIPITSMATVCIPTWQSFIRNTSNSSKMPCLFCSYSACLSRYLWFTEHRVTGERKKRGYEALCEKSQNFSTTQFYLKSMWHILSCKNQPFWQLHKREKKDYCFAAAFERTILPQMRFRLKFEWQKNPLLFLLCEAAEVNILAAAVPLYHLFS